MLLEEFIREHMSDDKKDFALSVAVDPNTKKITGTFHDNEPDGGEAHFRIEGNAVILQSHDTAMEKKAAAEKAAEEDKIRRTADADRKAKK